MSPGHTSKRGGLAEECEPVRTILARLGDKWSMLIVMALRDGPLRFNELKRRTATISQRMLTLSLRGMERGGLVKRTVTPTNPPRVDYELTKLGHSLCGPVEALGRWALEHRSEIETAQRRFDHRKREGATSPILVRFGQVSRRPMKHGS